jgi:hypothetical protein
MPFQTHPLHLVHLNFYTALSHDTLAREATLKTRRIELGNAETHYLTAINILSQMQQQPEAPRQEYPHDSPSSAFSDLVFPWQRRGSYDSLGSQRSGASSATSVFSDDLDSPHEPEAKEQNPQSPQATYGLSISRPAKRHDSAAALGPRPSPPTHSQDGFLANIASFARMLEGHLADVRSLRDKTSVPTVHFTTPSPQVSPKGLGLRPASRDSSACAGLAGETIWKRRRTVVFRARFDPASVKQLCQEAMAELAVAKDA